MRAARCGSSCGSRKCSRRPLPRIPTTEKTIEFDRGAPTIERLPPANMSERRKHLEFLRKTARDAIWAGDYDRALSLYEDGLTLARSWKDRGLEDLFTCNRATTLLEMDRQDFDLSALKEILLRSPANANGVLAAYAS